ncbi:SidA/IucD/PvdA family monooxygenase [Actinoplanes sp. NPDC051470]|uniref:lysine N(6)-hydroxylase/L-ornithine N(5)-oxygenase family protein n=1 Tax=unclassified Actinoplanes TaxID=2626549 RepID=UPI003445060E
MSSVQAGAGPSVHDVVGLGFGPANLALAVALREHAATTGRELRSVFLERQASFGWHRGMLIEGATMQVSFLKDLATMRNPVSPFGFLSYLKAKGRLADFVNHRSFYPTRVEFHDYLEWAARHFEDTVHYATEAVDVRPVVEGSDVVALDVASRRPGDPAERVYRTRNLVIATGLVPRLPSGVERSPRIMHSSELLGRLTCLGVEAPRRFAVVGAGQSAAEAAAHLHERYPQAEVFAILPRYGYSVADDSPFANQIFDAGAIDDFFEAAPVVKEKLDAYHANTNYSVVDLALIEELYRRAYQESVTGRRRLHLKRMFQVIAARSDRDRVSLSLVRAPGDPVTKLDVDIAVYATGYRPMDPSPLLSGIAGMYKQDSSGRLRVGRDYRVETRPGSPVGIYLQGGTEHTHGISSSLLSNLAVRAWDIVESVSASSAEPNIPAAAGADGGHRVRS